MGSNSKPYKLWVHQKNHSSSSLVRRGVDVGISPKHFSPRPSSQHYSTKALPPLPHEQDAKQLRDKGRSSWEPPVYREMMAQSPSRSVSRDSKTQLVRTPAIHSSQKRPKSHLVSQDVKTPPITKSSQKILQLTGFDPRFERSLPKEHQQVPEPVSPISSHSSESVYSQPESTYTQEKSEPVNYWKQGPISRTRGNDTGTFSQLSIYNTSPQMVSAQSSVTSLRHRDRPAKPHRAATMLSDYPDPEKVTTLRELLAQEQARNSQEFEDDSLHQDYSEFQNDSPYRQGYELTDVEHGSMVPEPLALWPKTKPKHIQVETKDNIRYRARDSLETVINEISSPSKKEQNSTPAPPLFSDEEEFIPRTPQSKAKRKIFGAGNFGTGNHPLKSPFPFADTSNFESSPEDIPTEGFSKFSKRVTGAMKHFSGGSRSSPTNKTIISNGARKAEGLDTPWAGKTSFMTLLPSPATMQRRSEYLQDVVTKAKKTVHLKTAEQRKRENLKKKILVVGITDQDPDGRVSECL